MRLMLSGSGERLSCEVRGPNLTKEATPITGRKIRNAHKDDHLAAVPFPRADSIGSSRYPDKPFGSFHGSEKVQTTVKGTDSFQASNRKRQLPDGTASGKEIHEEVLLEWILRGRHLGEIREASVSVPL
jgi:hypothetical protein